MKFFQTFLGSIEFIFGLVLLIGFIIWLIKTPWRKNAKQLAVEISKKPVAIILIIAGLASLAISYSSHGVVGLVLIALGIGVIVGESI